MNTHPTTATYDALLARVTDFLPDMPAAERLELLGVMDPDEMRQALAFAASTYPQVSDFALVREVPTLERLYARTDEDTDDEEPYCETCGAAVGIFHAHGDADPLPQRGHRGQPRGAVRRRSRARDRVAPGRRAVSDTDMAAEVTELRERLAGTVNWVTGLIGAARAEGYAEGYGEGRAENDGYPAAARAQQARAGFQVLPGGKTARTARPARLRCVVNDHDLD